MARYAARITDEEFDWARYVERLGIARISQVIRALERRDEEKLQEFQRLVDERERDLEEFKPRR